MKVTSILNKEGNQYAEQTDKWWLVKSKMSSVKPIPNLKTPYYSLINSVEIFWYIACLCSYLWGNAQKIYVTLIEGTQLKIVVSRRRIEVTHFCWLLSELSTYTNRKTNIKQWLSITEMTVLVWKYKKNNLSSTIVWFSICINFISFLL